MTSKSRKAISSLLVAAYVFAFSGANLAQAAGATILLSPSKGNISVGSNFTVGVYVNSGGAGINAAEGTISFNTALVSVNSVSQSGSIFEMWTSKPAFSNKNGTVTFGGGLTSSYKGSSGKLFSISFKALKAGTASMSIGSGVVTAADGLGTNVYSGGGGGTYTISDKAADPTPTPPPVTKPVETKPTTQTTTTNTTPITTPVQTPTETAPANKNVILPPAPEINSTTHPNQEEWYPVNKVSLSWKLLPSITDAASLFNEQASSTPNEKDNAIGVVQEKTYDKVANGRHYFHINLKNKSGWGPVAHRQVLVDTELPTTPKLEIDSGGDATNPTPLLRIGVEDKVSGLSKIKVNLNGTDKELEPKDYWNSPYQLSQLLPGRYTVAVTAYDKASNVSSSTLSFVVEPLKSPMITDMPKTMKESDGLTIRGASFYPSTNIQLFIAPVGGDPVKYDVKTDENGDWNYFHNSKLKQGNYEVWAKVVDGRGAESLNSSKQALTVTQPEFIATYGIYVILVLLFIIVILVLYIMLLKKRHQEEKDRILAETAGAQKKVTEIFLALQEEVDELIVYADKKPGLSESEKRIKEKVKEALDISEEFLTKEIEDIEKEVVIPKRKKK